MDDTPDIAELLRIALQQHGYDVAVTGYTTAINERLAQENAEAVVLDCTAFDMSESLFDTLRSEGRHTQMPVVIVTDTPEEGVASLRARKARHVRLVPKPFKGSQVVAALDELLTPPTESDRPLQS